MQNQKLNPYSSFLIETFEKDTSAQGDKSTTVNPIISELATFYEKIRNVMDYRDEEVVLRSAIHRILKRRILIVGGNGDQTAHPLIRELIWARYFPEGSISDKTVSNIAKRIDLYNQLRKEVTNKYKFNEAEMFDWFMEVLSADIERILNESNEKEIMVNYMFHILKSHVEIENDDEETKNVQLFIAIRKAYSKDDRALLRYHLFSQFFGHLNDKSYQKTIHNFKDGYEKIEYHLEYPLRYKILGYVKKKTPAFIILNDMLLVENFKDIINDQEQLADLVIATCQKRYKNISEKVQRAIIRSIFFILLTKAIIALGIEGTYDNLVYGRVMWNVITINILSAPFLMIITGLFIKIPGHKNSLTILQQIQTILFSPEPVISQPIFLKKITKPKITITDTIFGLLWVATFILSFGLVVYVLTKLHFNIVSQGIFLFFLAIVCFLAYRINRTASIYTVETRQGLLTPIVDFFILPIVQTGRYLTEGISQVNILLFILDFIIETPFKGLFAFFEQWFLFIHSKRDNLE